MSFNSALSIVMGLPSKSRFKAASSVRGRPRCLASPFPDPERQDANRDIGAHKRFGDLVHRTVAANGHNCLPFFRVHMLVYELGRMGALLREKDLSRTGILFRSGMDSLPYSLLFLPIEVPELGFSINK
jgi:hypothetical protein